tara:strand:- start:880 stop:1581 length:702 start_codon:yes stop_codon:yes gene_type:complete
MNIKRRGILLFTKVNKENNLYIKFISETDEIISGIVYGGLSKNKRNILQIGFFLSFNITMKDNRPPSIQAELSEPFISSIINDKYKLNCLMTVIALINISIIEGQKVKNIYEISSNFIKFMFTNKKWLYEYFIFLYNFLKILGYEVDFKNNSKYKYFDLQSLEFKQIKSVNTIESPFVVFQNNSNKIKLLHLNQLFKIFEIVLEKNHLSNLNLNLPNQYHLFKKLIIDRISLA